MKAATTVVGLLASLATTAGCNYLGIDAVTANRNQVAVVTGTLTLDPGVQAAGAMVHVTVDAPLSMLGCTTTNSNTMISQAARVSGQKEQLVAIADAAWAGNTTIFTCQLYVPPNAVAGYYAVKLTHAELSAPMGRKLGVTVYNGVVHVPS